MQLQEKLDRLGKLDDLALYKWTAGKNRIAQNYILLSDLRLNVLTCNRGEIVFSSAAPVLYMNNNRSVIELRDSEVMTVLDGRRQGINILAFNQQPGERVAPARFCESRKIVSDDCPKWLENKILSMGNSDRYPYADVVTPTLFRITKHPETLNPIFDSVVRAEIGAKPTDGIAELKRKFLQHSGLFGTYTPEGYIANNHYILSGGVCVAASKGITLRSGSIVHQISLRTFLASINRKRWHIHTASRQENDNDNNNGENNDVAG